MKSREYREDPLFLRNQQYMVGEYDMPYVYAQEVITDGIKLVGFNNIRNDSSRYSLDKTVHFFLDDYKFDEVWKMPEHELARLSEYAQVFSPDFSVYSDMPEPIQIYNTFRNRWCASYWQFNKLLVIPTVSWGGVNTFDFCFDGIEVGSVVAVSTLGIYNDQDEFMAGFARMCEVIDPYRVINYGSVINGMDKLATVIEIPYKHGSQRDEA
jgi:hypothetical protein